MYFKTTLNVKNHPFAGTSVTLVPHSHESFATPNAESTSETLALAKRSRC